MYSEFRNAKLKAKYVSQASPAPHKCTSVMLLAVSLPPAVSPADGEADDGVLGAQPCLKTDGPAC